jgi:hypothetical protein
LVAIILASVLVLETRCHRSLFFQPCALVD